MRIHLVPRGTMPPLPPMIKGDKDKVLQGGLPPVPYRTIYTKVSGHHKSNQKHTHAHRAYRAHGDVTVYVGASAQAKLA